MAEIDITTVKQRYGIIGNSDEMNRALSVALRVAPTDLSVLVTGESGVGKEFFPKVIHSHSARKHNKYIDKTFILLTFLLLQNIMLGYNFITSGVEGTSSLGLIPLQRAIPWLRG